MSDWAHKFIRRVFTENRFPIDFCRTGTTAVAPLWPLKIMPFYISFAFQTQSFLLSVMLFIYLQITMAKSFQLILILLYSPRPSLSTNRSYWRSSINKNCWSTTERWSNNVTRSSWRSSSGNTNSNSSKTRRGDKRVSSDCHRELFLKKATKRSSSKMCTVLL